MLAWGGIAVALLLGALAANHPSSYRLVLAVALAVNLLIVATRWPGAAAVLTLAYLPLLALVRRLLIADAGWTQYDPLLLVAPLVALFLVARLFVLERREPARDGISKLVWALLALTVLQSFNPMLGSIVAGAGGFMFLGVPLLWFFIGRELADRRVVLSILYGVVAVAVAIGAYGLWQTEVGLPSCGCGLGRPERLPGAATSTASRERSALSRAAPSTGSSWAWRWRSRWRCWFIGAGSSRSRSRSSRCRCSSRREGGGGAGRARRARGGRPAHP